MVEVNIDGNGKTIVRTGLQFIDHLITTIGRHSMSDIKLTAKSNDGIIHHLVEDIAIALSMALSRALHDRSQVKRFGYSVVPMDESLAVVSIDLVQRQFYKMEVGLAGSVIEGIQKEDLDHFTRSLVQNLNACTHILVKYGDNDHHKIEAAMKAFAVAFRMAASIDEKGYGPPSTKGHL
jgi:imidazoleglycerol-phosphate dehydratase